ncbi:MAG TPA: hypothetical protein VG053_12060 [Solirubrobacteraceae bacterium]|nr:hypothetical protein [Solirubrobacteraceae bacterium]
MTASTLRDPGLIVIVSVSPGWEVSRVPHLTPRGGRADRSRICASSLLACELAIAAAVSRRLYGPTAQGRLETNHENS